MAVTTTETHASVRLMLRIVTRSEAELDAVIEATGESPLALARMIHEGAPLSPAVLRYLGVRKTGKQYTWEAA